MVTVVTSKYGWHLIFSWLLCFLNYLQIICIEHIFFGNQGEEADKEKNHKISIRDFPDTRQPLLKPTNRCSPKPAKMVEEPARRQAAQPWESSRAPSSDLPGAPPTGGEAWRGEGHGDRFSAQALGQQGPPAALPPRVSTSCIAHTSMFYAYYISDIKK